MSKEEQTKEAIRHVQVAADELKAALDIMPVEHGHTVFKFAADLRRDVAVLGIELLGLIAKERKERE